MFIGDRSFIFVLPVIRMYNKEVILSMCSYVTRLISGIEAGMKDTEKIALISSPEKDLMLTDDLPNKYR